MPWPSSIAKSTPSGPTEAAPRSWFTWSAPSRETLANAALDVSGTSACPVSVSPRAAASRAAAASRSGGGPSVARSLSVSTIDLRAFIPSYVDAIDWPAAASRSTLPAVAAGGAYAEAAGFGGAYAGFAAPLGGGFAAPLRGGRPDASMRAAAICCVGGCAGEARDGGDAGEDGSSCRRGAGFASGVNHAPYADDEVCEERSEVRCAERSRRCCARRAADDIRRFFCGDEEEEGSEQVPLKIAHMAAGCGVRAG